MMKKILINIKEQQLLLFNSNKCVKKYFVSTAANGVGEENGSGKTPRGSHVIRAKIGTNCLVNTVFKARRPTGEIYSLDLRNSFPERDWILTRILWLSGQEIGKNRLGKVDTMRRYIYIHGSPDDEAMGIPGSHGCIRMRNQDILELFEQVCVGDQVVISEVSMGSDQLL